MKPLHTAAITLTLLFNIAQAGEIGYTEEIRVTATPETVWNALTKPEIVKTYHLAPLQKIEIKKGGAIIYGRGDKVMISGTITEIEPNVKLAHTFRFGPDKHPGTPTDSDTLVTYSIRKEGAFTVMKLAHSGFVAKDQTYTNATGGWPFILKKLKAVLDAGQPPSPPKPAN
jgi:uncharacterized protein YndB with AHSA1/START domain